MSIEKDIKNKNVPLKDLLKKKKKASAEKSEGDQDFGIKKKKIVIKKSKTESPKKVIGKQPKSEFSDSNDSGVKIVSSLDSSSTKKGPVKNLTSSAIKIKKEEPVAEIKKPVPIEGKKKEEDKERKDTPAEKSGVEKDKVENKEKSTSTSESEEHKKKKDKDRRDQKYDEWSKKKLREEEDKLQKVISQHAKQKDEVIPKGPILPKSVEILENITVGDLAKKMSLKASDVIAKLMKLGMMATINQVLDSETATLVASEFDIEVKIVSLYDETIIEHDREDKSEDYRVRPPVITIMGHVDHGKTRLLDAIRESNVILGEAGGITQHIGAYQVEVNGKKLTFLDTPGHEAFTMMRSRGASVTDIVILVVAADDGVMPQTLEAINHAKDAGVPIIVAINKIDLEAANPEKIKQELSSYELVPEEWGGQTIFVELSAKQKINIDQLLEMITLQSELLELKANPSIAAKGSIIEAKLDQGRGPVATVLIQQGTLKIQDPFVAGIYYGRVRAIFNDLGEKIETAGPSDPVEIIGLSGVPDAGDPFEAVESERYAKQICQKRQELRRHEESQRIQKVTLEHLNEMIAMGDVKELKVIIKADVRGSAEALRDALEGLSNEQVTVNCIHTGTGAINESDIVLASASNAIIIGFHVRPNNKASDLASKESVEMKFYNIIYNVVDDIRGAMEGMLDPELQEQANGKGEIREIFKISKVGTIAGAYVLSGKIARSHKVRIIREGEIIHDGVFRSLKRFKEDVNEISSGFECGFSMESFNDLQVGDQFETYEIKEVKQVLKQ